MILAREPEGLRSLLDEARHRGDTVGLHPTMGALHGGHEANIAKMAAECDTAAVTIFVNPLQFGPGEDFSSYPRDLEADLSRAERAGAGIVFAPPMEAMYPEEPLVSVTVPKLADGLEGARRPGHFDGVATVVTKLLALAGPCYAYFGEKDYQQLVIVRRLVKDLSLPAVVVACPTVRETDGLALSSRNAYLSPAERRAAPALYWALLAGKRAVDERGEREADAVRDEMRDVLLREELVEPDYAEVTDPGTLEPLGKISGEVRLLVAARLGRARLIDNLAAGAGEG